jgi:serine/threonine protein phosphatase PrpC
MVESFGLSDPGRVRANNEDYFLIAPNLGLYIVADGMGGEQAGECASRFAVETVADYLTANDRFADNALTAAFEEANRCVHAASAAASQLRGMGTTLVAALAQGEGVRIASVGDSRVYFFEDGALRLVTDDQTWVNDVGRRLGLDEAALKTHSFRHVVTMAIGVSDPLEVRTYAVRPRAGTLLLLCSDGLHGVIDDSRIAAVLSKHIELEQCAHGLIDAAREAGGPDNITVVLLRFAG